MHRTELPPGQGMLFVFELPRRACFWMRNTWIPLDVVFIGTDGRIAEVIARPDVLSTQSRCSSQPVPYVLELPLGWLAERGLGPGDLVLGLGSLAAPPDGG